jgi:site-specific DNA recombinase
MKRLMLAYEEDLVSLDELRGRMPELRKKEKFLIGEIESIDRHLADEETHLKLAENLESFLARLRDAASNSSVHDRQQVLRLVVREVLVETDSVVLQHTIPGLDPGGRSTCHLWGYRPCSDPQDT